jgi:transposase
MLGRRTPQMNMFDAANLPHRVAPDSFYGQMGAVAESLFPDDDLKALYDPATGRPSLPPSLLAGVVLLQFYDDVSDGEAVERTLYDLRWKVALHLPLDYAGFDPSSLSYFRKRLVAGQQERYAFDRLLKVGRTAGFIPATVTAIFDTTHTGGAGAVQDTYTLLRKGLRKLLKTGGFALPGKRQGLAPEVARLVATYLDQDRKAAIDWADPTARAEQLKVLAADAEAALDAILPFSDDAEVRTLGWLLTKVLGDDLVTDAQGQVQLGEGTAPERIISSTDPEMHHGRKSAAHRFDGFKAVFVTEQSSELLLDVADAPAPGSDGRQLLPALHRAEAAADVTVVQVLADGACGSGDIRATCADELGHAVDLVVPVAQPADPAVAKAAFQIDLPAQTATCPQGQTVAGQPCQDAEGRAILSFTFARATCEACPLFSRCVRSKTLGRTVRTNAHEELLQAARLRQQTAAFKVLYPLRSAIERKGAELVCHGLRHTRYLGQPKRQFQRLWLGAAVNLKRLFKLAAQRQVDLAAVLSQLNARPGCPAAV